MPNQNPTVASELRRAKEELARLRIEKARLYPPNRHPFIQPDEFPGQYTPEQIQHRNMLVSQIEQLERRIDELQDRLYTG